MGNARQIEVVLAIDEREPTLSAVIYLGRDSKHSGSSREDIK
jgi:hypothetical protein